MLPLKSSAEFRGEVECLSRRNDAWGDIEEINASPIPTIKLITNKTVTIPSERSKDMSSPIRHIPTSVSASGGLTAHLPVQKSVVEESQEQTSLPVSLGGLRPDFTLQPSLPVVVGGLRPDFRLVSTERGEQRRSIKLRWSRRLKKGAVIMPESPEFGNRPFNSESNSVRHIAWSQPSEPGLKDTLTGSPVPGTQQSQIDAVDLNDPFDTSRTSVSADERSDGTSSGDEVEYHRRRRLSTESSNASLPTTNQHLTLDFRSSRESQHHTRQQEAVRPQSSGENRSPPTCIHDVRPASQSPSRYHVPSLQGNRVTSRIWSSNHPEAGRVFQVTPQHGPARKSRHNRRPRR